MSWVSISWLYLLTLAGCEEAPVLGEEDQVLTESIESAKWFFGILLFAGFVSYGFVYPVWTKLGCKCCGKEFMPTKHEMETQDHVMNEPKEMQLSSPMVQAILTKMKSMRGDAISPVPQLGQVVVNHNPRSSKSLSKKVNSPSGQVPLMAHAEKNE